MPWRGCRGVDGSYAAAVNEGECRLFGNRLSASIIYAGMKERPRAGVHSVIDVATGSRNDHVDAASTLAEQALHGKGEHGERLHGIPIFSRTVGVVYRPGYVKIMCSYGGDGGSRGTSDGCGTSFCPDGGGKYVTIDAWCDGKPHASLGAMLRGHAVRGGYNELIIETADLERQLPEAIEAIFYVRGTHQETFAKSVFDNFHATYAAAWAERRASDRPLLKPVALLELNPTDWETPFSDGSPSNFVRDRSAEEQQLLRAAADEARRPTGQFRPKRA